MVDTYRGSLKHKNRPANGRKGTICPEWTHTNATGALALDPHVFDWEGTPAAEMFGSAAISPEDGRRYATQCGIAFEAKSSADGTWHGFPIPWENVPAQIKDDWLDRKLVKGSQVKRYLSRPENDIKWALETDDE
jgi:hypothetical protein